MTSFCKTLLLSGEMSFVNPKNWVGVAPLKVKVFSWVVGLKKILTIDNLHLLKMIIVNACPLYLSDLESVDHLLLHYQFSYQIWMPFFQLLGFAYCLSHLWCQLFNEERVISGSSFRRRLWSTTIPSIIWSLWLERNKRIFRRKKSSFMHLLDIIKLRTAWWIVESEKFKGVSISDVCRDWASVDLIIHRHVIRPHVPWSPPGDGHLKINFDGSCLCEIGLAGYGGVICNAVGSIVLSFVGSIANGSVNEAELFALWRGIMELEALGVRGCLIKGDSKVVVGSVLGSSCPWLFLDKIEKIRNTISIFDFKIAWAP